MDGCTEGCIDLQLAWGGMEKMQKGRAMMKEGSGIEKKKMADEQMTNSRTDGMRRGKNTGTEGKQP